MCVAGAHSGPPKQRRQQLEQLFSGHKASQLVPASPRAPALPCPSLPCPAPPCSYDTSRGISETLPDAAAAARLRSPAPACLYFIDHTYRVIYARITKTAGSAVVRSFGHIKHAPLCR